MLGKTVLTAAALLALAGSAHANLVLDGSFEEVPISTPGWGYYTTVPGWTLAGGPLELRNDVVGSAQDGNNFAELDSINNMSISQTIDTIVGERYTLTFWYSSRPTDPNYNQAWPGNVVPGSSNGMKIDLGEGAVTVYTPTANTTPQNQWQEYTTTFVATSTLTTLTFLADGCSDSYGTSLDNITLTAAVPEPAETSLMLAGLLMLGGIARRRAGRA
jgi:hypothetical protein